MNRTIFALTLAMMTLTACDTATDSGEETFELSSSCTAGRFDNGFSVEQCCEDGGEMFVKQSSTAVILHRSFLSGDLPCRNSDGSTGCGLDVGIHCWHGPLGAHTVGLMPYSAAGVIFQPDTEPNLCGVDLDGATAGGAFGSPASSEEYDGSQTIWTGVTGTATPYSSCRSDGSPGMRVTLTATCTGSTSGTVSWNGNSVSCNGDGTMETKEFWAALNSSGKVKQNNGMDFAGWSGDCTGNGNCNITASADRSVTGSFVD